MDEYGDERGASISNRLKLFLSKALALRATIGAPHPEHWRHSKRDHVIQWSIHCLSIPIVTDVDKEG